MSEQDRMDRAKRIRQMREGNRSDDQDETEATDATETGTEDAGAATATVASTDPDAETASEEASGTRAPVPSAEEMQELQAEAGVEAVDATPEAEGTDAESVEPEAVPAEAATDAESAAGMAGVEQAAAESTEPDTRVLEFRLADEQYCLDIQYIEEIVKQEAMTRVPNTPAFVEGVVDLRGQITTILNPKVAIGKDDESAGDLIVVFDPDSFDEQGNIGWVVDDVRQVSPVAESEVNDPPMQEDYINGVIDRDDDEQFVIWTTPDLALDEAA